MDASPPVSIPRLHTQRLILREYRAGDFPRFAAHLADPESTKFIGTGSRKDAWRIFGCHVGAWVLRGAGWWALELRDAGEFVGNVGAFYREGMDVLEVGWNTFRPYWGQGLASEAAAEAVRYCFETREEKSLIALVDAENTPSRRIIARLGFQYEGETDLFGTKVQRHALAR